MIDANVIVYILLGIEYACLAFIVGFIIGSRSGR